MKNSHLYIFSLLLICLGCRSEDPLLFGDSIPVFEPQVVSYRSDKMVKLEWWWLTWDKSIEPARREPERFEILASEVSPDELEVIGSVKLGQVTYDITELENGKPYYFAIRALADGGISAMSNIVMTIPGISPTTSPLVPDAPADRLEGSWSPDGKEVAIAVGQETMASSPFSGTGIYIFNLDAQTSRFLGKGNAPDWSPNGQEIACFRSADGGSPIKTFITTYGLSANGYSFLRGGDAFFHSPTWSIDGQSMIFLEGADTVSQFDIVRMPITAAASSPEIRLTLSLEDLLNDAVTDAQQSPTRPVPIPDGSGVTYYKWTYDQGEYVQRIFNLSFDTNVSSSIFASRYNDRSPTYDPTGKRMAFISDRSGEWAIWTFDLETSGYQQLTDGKGIELYLSKGKLEWNFAGDRLLFTGKSPEGYANIYSLSTN